MHSVMSLIGLECDSPNLDVIDFWKYKKRCWSISLIADGNGILTVKADRE